MPAAAAAPSASTAATTGSTSIATPSEETATGDDGHLASSSQVTCRGVSTISSAAASSPSRKTVSVTSEPTFGRSRFSRLRGSPTSSPSILAITSPSRTPAAAAGDCFWTARTPPSDIAMPSTRRGSGGTRTSTVFSPASPSASEAFRDTVSTASLSGFSERAATISA